MANALRGKISFFGGPGETTASGLPSTHPGIAVYNHATLGGWWRIHFPNGKTAVLQQTDIGPAPWTKRLIDVSVGALGEAGYNQSNFPTDKEVVAEYLGKGPFGVTGHTTAAPTGKVGAQPVGTILPSFMGSIIGKNKEGVPTVFGIPINPFGETSEGVEHAFEHPLQGGPFEPVEKAGEATIQTGEFLVKLTEAGTWIRIGEGVGGFLLLYLGLSNLTHKTTLGRSISGETSSGGGAVKTIVTTAIGARAGTRAARKATPSKPTPKKGPSTTSSTRKGTKVSYSR